MSFVSVEWEIFLPKYNIPEVSLTKKKKKKKKLITVCCSTNEPVDVVCETLSSVVYQLLPTLLVLAQQGSNLLALPPNEEGHLSARSLLKIAKWVQESEDKYYSWINTITTGWLSLDLCSHPVNLASSFIAYRL